MAGSTGNKNLKAYLVNHLQGFELNPEVYNLSTSGMELIGFPSKNLNQENSSVFWKGFSNKPGNHVGSPSSSLKGINVPGSSGESYKHGLTGIADSSMVSPENSFVDFSSLRCIFPCEGNERPGKGLSLSLYSSNPSSVSLQSFELRQEADLRFDPSSSRSVNINRQQQYMMQDDSQFGNSKFLGPAQELLNEFCNLGTNKTDSSKQKIQKISERQDENAMSKQSLYALDHLGLQKRMNKLLQMLEEVDRRYKHYCDQMKVVVSSFEAVSGNGAATVYSALASRAMSKHFRCLKDGILSQIKATEKAMGDKDSSVPGTSKGETPRLRLLDQALRRQRAFQQTSLMENHPWRPQRGLPERSVSVLRAWLFEHFLHPYPNDIDKHALARQTGLSRSQVSNWFINARVRLWKPMVEEMYLEELKDHDGVQGTENDEFLYQNLSRNEDQKPTHDQLVRIHSESLSSILDNIPPEKNGGKSNKTLENEAKIPCFGGVGDSFGAVELDLSSYTYNSAAVGSGTPTVSYSGSGGGGVSLTLGLHQHGLQNSLFYPRYYDMEDCQTAQYLILEGENQNLPYRNMVGTQLLHDLAG